MATRFEPLDLDDQDLFGIRLHGAFGRGDRQRLLEVARGLFAGCPDALRPGEKLDEALAKEGEIKTFLQQGITEATSIDSTLSGLRQLTGVA